MTDRSFFLYMGKKNANLEFGENGVKSLVENNSPSGGKNQTIRIE